MASRSESTIVLGLFGFAMVGIYVAVMQPGSFVEEVGTELRSSVVEVDHGRFLGGTAKLYTKDHDDDPEMYCKDPKVPNDPEGCFVTCKSTDQATICRGFGADSCKKLDKEDAPLGLFLVVLGLLYLFIGIAIICDELFVPALEVLAEQMELSNDVAGATLMAAGGSAPELATSFVGVFQRSDVGFGTIVGSAVFNVLFVIGICAMVTPPEFSPLALTWWPLFRDCLYYVLTLITLAVFMNDGVIELWEAAVQFLMYFGYVFLMKNSSRLEEYVKNRGKSATIAAYKDEEAGGAIEKSPSTVEKIDDNASFQRPSTFRAGILQLLTSKTSVTETAGVACVSRIKGDVYEVFDTIDKNKNGTIEPEELKELFQIMGVEDVTPEKLEATAKEIDSANNGIITKREFVVWYTKSEERIMKETKQIFDKFDANGSGTIDREEIQALLLALGNKPTPQDVESAMNTINLTEGELNFQDFNTWYKDSLFWTKQTDAADEAAESCESMWEGIQGGWLELSEADVPLRAKINYLICLPLCLFFCIVPDCRPPGCEGRAVGGFFMSIFVIALLAIVMVELATIFGDSLGIPTVVMGLTVLAAGTSVPDLLSSVIVAKQGEGDMAVSSSIGSNIFDVAVGLPVPWLVFGIAAHVNSCHCMVIVGSDGLFISLIILVAMIFFIVSIIQYCNWKMTKTLGWSMFGMYFAFVAQALARESDWGAATCSVPFSFNPLGV
jgi:sodium/potassium/calcium exchanger 2